MQKEFPSSHKLKDHAEKSLESVELSKFISHRAKILEELDSRKDPFSTKFKQRPQVFINLSFGELCNSKLSGLHPFDNMAIIH